MGRDREIAKVTKYLAGCAAGMWMITAPAAAAEFRALSSWDQSYLPRTALFEKLLKNIENASKGDIKFRISGPETVPPFEQLQPAGSNVFQILFTHGAYHFGTTPYLVAIEGLSGDLAKWRSAGLKDQVEKHYQRFGLKLLALPQVPEGSAYNIMLKAPVGPSGDLQGRKIRATQTYAGVLSMLGASPVNLPPAEIYPSLEKGVVDGAAGRLSARSATAGTRWRSMFFGRALASSFIPFSSARRAGTACRKPSAKSWKRKHARSKTSGMGNGRSSRR